MSSIKKIVKVSKDPKDSKNSSLIHPTPLSPSKSPTKSIIKPHDKPIPSIKELEHSKTPTLPREVHISQSPSKEKSSSHLHSHTTELEAKIKSRKRLLETLHEQTSFCNDDVILQLHSRDSIIEEQNKEIVALRARIKQEKKKDSKKSKIKPEAQRITELENEKNSIENKHLIIVDKLRNEIFKLEEEKISFEAMQETLKEEIEILKSTIWAKDSEIFAMVHDIQKLSEIIEQFKDLNQELNQKIEKQNSDFELMSAKFYENEVRVVSMAEVENSLQDYMDSYQRSEIRANKLFEELRAAQMLYDDLQAFCKFAEEKLEKAQKEIEGDKEAVKMIRDVRVEMGRKTKIEMTEKQEKQKSEKIRRLQMDLDRAKLRIEQIQLEYKPITDQVWGLKDIIENMRKSSRDSLENLNKTIKTMQDYIETLKSDLASSRSDTSKKDARLASALSKLAASEAKVTSFPEKIKKMQENLQETEKENSEYKQKIFSIKSQLNEKNSYIYQLEKQNVKYVLNIQALHEEFWKKDTSLIRAKKALAQLEKSISASQNKSPSAKSYENKEKLLKEIQEKDQKIEILKEMVKSSQVKKEGKRLSPETSLYEIHSEKNSKFTHELINSLASKTINKFFTLWSFHKTTTSENTPDLQRLLKKLKQDLRSYSNFNVKELQNAVTQLQYHYFDNKQIISLDELISAISKVVNQ